MALADGRQNIGIAFKLALDSRISLLAASATNERANSDSDEQPSQKFSLALLFNRFVLVSFA